MKYIRILLLVSLSILLVACGKTETEYDNAKDSVAYIFPILKTDDLDISFDHYEKTADGYSFTLTVDNDGDEKTVSLYDVAVNQKPCEFTCEDISCGENESCELILNTSEMEKEQYPELVTFTLSVMEEGIIKYYSRSQIQPLGYSITSSVPMPAESSRPTLLEDDDVIIFDAADSGGAEDDYAYSSLSYRILNLSDSLQKVRVSATRDGMEKRYEYIIAPHSYYPIAFITYTSKEIDLSVDTVEYVAQHVNMKTGKVIKETKGSISCR